MNARIVDSVVETPTCSFIWTVRKAGGNVKNSELTLAIVGKVTLVMSTRRNDCWVDFASRNRPSSVVTLVVAPLMWFITDELSS